MINITLYYESNYFVKIDEYREFLALLVGAVRLRFHDKSSTRSQLPINSLEQPLDAHISEVEVNPLCDAQRHDDVILFVLKLHSEVTVWHAVALQIG